MIGGGRPLKCKFCIKETTTLPGCRAFIRICIAIVTMEYQITNDVY